MYTVSTIVKDDVFKPSNVELIETREVLVVDDKGKTTVCQPQAKWTIPWGINGEQTYATVMHTKCTKELDTLSQINSRTSTWRPTVTDNAFKKADRSSTSEESSYAQ